MTDTRVARRCSRGHKHLASFHVLLSTLWVLVACTAGCGPTNVIIPLRGEDPDSLIQSGEQMDWLRKTGATRAVESFRAALIDEEYGTCLDLLGPATRAILKSRAASLGSNAIDLLEKIRIEGLALRGAAHPLEVLRSPGAVQLKEDQPFDPKRTRTTVVARLDGHPDAVEIPALFTPDGWRIELVRIVETEPPQ